MIVPAKKRDLASLFGTSSPPSRKTNSARLKIANLPHASPVQRSVKSFRRFKQHNVEEEIFQHNFSKIYNGVISKTQLVQRARTADRPQPQIRQQPQQLFQRQIRECLSASRTNTKQTPQNLQHQDSRSKTASISTLMSRFHVASYAQVAPPRSAQQYRDKYHALKLSYNQQSINLRLHQPTDSGARPRSHCCSSLRDIDYGPTLCSIEHSAGYSDKVHGLHTFDDSFQEIDFGQFQVEWRQAVHPALSHDSSTDFDDSKDDSAFQPCDKARPKTDYISIRKGFRSGTDEKVQQHTAQKPATSQEEAALLSSAAGPRELAIKNLELQHEIFTQQERLADESEYYYYDDE